MPAIVAYTQQQLLDLFGRILPIGYWQPIVDREGDGLEIFQGIAQALTLTSQQVEAFWKGGLLTLAAFGAYSKVEVELFRPSATLGAVDVLAGTVVTTSNGGRDFTLDSVVSFGALDLGPKTVMATAIYPDEEFNVPGQRVTAFGEIFPGSIDTIKALQQNPPYGDPTIQVRQIPDATGGAFPALEQLGEDRGLPRLLGELVDVYRWRIQQLPDVVTPNAILRLITGLFSSYGLSSSTIEQNDLLYQTCYDGPATTFPSSDYDPNLFCYDDPRPTIPFRNRWLDEIEARGAFIVIVPNLQAVSDFRFIFDDPALSPGDFVTVAGQRAYSAYDIPVGSLLVGKLQGVYDGFDLGKQAFYKGLFAQLEGAKAAGVFVVIELEGN